MKKVIMALALMMTTSVAMATPDMVELYKEHGVNCASYYGYENIKMMVSPSGDFKYINYDDQEQLDISNDCELEGTVLKCQQFDFNVDLSTFSPVHNLNDEIERYNGDGELYLGFFSGTVRMGCNIWLD